MALRIMVLVDDVCKRLSLDVVYSKGRETETGTHEEKEEEERDGFDWPGQDSLPLESRMDI